MTNSSVKNVTTSRERGWIGVKWLKHRAWLERINLKQRVQLTRKIKSRENKILAVVFIFFNLIPLSIHSQPSPISATAHSPPATSSYCPRLFFMLFSFLLLLWRTTAFILVKNIFLIWYKKYNIYSDYKFKLENCKIYLINLGLKWNYLDVSLFFCILISKNTMEEFP